MSNGKSSKVIKLVIGILLLPCCVAITLTFVHQLQGLGRGGGLLRDWPFLCLALGFLLWLVIYLVMPAPTRAYVLGHELTHALWGLMMGAKVRNIKASAKGGQVTLSKTNFLITLAPYFFPFYCMLAIVLFLVCDFFFDWSRYVQVLYIIVGLGWGFHLTFTIDALSRRQTDVTQNGWIFSIALIYWMNLLVLGLILATIVSRGRVWLFVKMLWHSHRDVWVWIFRSIKLMVG